MVLEIVDSMFRTVDRAHNPYPSGLIRLWRISAFIFSQQAAGYLAGIFYEISYYIKYFGQDKPDDRTITIKAEVLFSEPKTTDAMCPFFGVRLLDRSQIEAMLRKPVNAQIRGIFPKHSERMEGQKLATSICFADGRIWL